MAAVGDPVPALDHAISVSLPSWESTIGYEEGSKWVVNKMKNGYPRFLIHSEVKALGESIVARYGQMGQAAMLFPSLKIARQCHDFVEMRCNTKYYAVDPDAKDKCEQILELHVQGYYSEEANDAATVFALLLTKTQLKVALKFWQHTGEGISSRRARFLQQAFESGRLELCLGSKTTNGDMNMIGCDQPMSSEDRAKELLTNSAKSAIKARIAGNFSTYERSDLFLNRTPVWTYRVRNVSEDNVFLYPTGMSAIFNVHQLLMKARGPLRSIMFGFPYIDTLKILQNFGPGYVFFGNSSEAELDKLQARCEKGERFLALFCEFPSNPLLTTPNLLRINQLADRFDFTVVVDDTIGNFLNVNVLPLADVVVCSLTKAFSGTGNVMGGSHYYDMLREILDDVYRDNYWSEDAIVMEQNSRDFLGRNRLVNENAQRLCEELKASPLIKDVFYPSLSPTKSYYDAHRTRYGGYGGLFSFTFRDSNDARCFFDAVAVAKGPGLGTNFTLASPYVILAHYYELKWAASYGVPADLIRVSVGIEEYDEILATFKAALRAAEERQRD